VAQRAGAGDGDGVMFALNRTTRVFLKVGATDLRLGFDGLHGQVVTILKQDALLCVRLQYVARLADLPGFR
jgi:hypothetical protein